MTDLTGDIFFLKFSLRAMTAALPLAHAREVLPMAELIRPPRLEPTVEGLLNLGGISYPVLRLDRLLQLDEAAPTLDTHLILTRATASPCLLMVDRVLGVERVSASLVTPVPDYVTTSACVKTQYPSGETAVHVLDLGTLIAAPTRALKVVA